MQRPLVPLKGKVYQCVAVAMVGDDYLNYPYCMATVQSVNYVARQVTVEWWVRVATDTVHTKWNTACYLHRRKVEDAKKIKAKEENTGDSLVIEGDFSTCMCHPHRLAVTAIDTTWVQSTY